VIFAGLDNEGWEPVEPPTQGERQSGGTPVISIQALLQARLERAQGGIPDVSAFVKGVTVSMSSAESHLPR
jgi:hypothetical protein